MIQIKRHIARAGLMILRAAAGDEWFGGIVFQEKGLYFLVYDESLDKPLIWMKTSMKEGLELFKLLREEG